MVDNLDIEALHFINSYNAQFHPSEKLKKISSNIHITGKKTFLSKNKRMSQYATYISEEPERFEKYVEDFKNEFYEEEQAKNLIKKKWSEDSSLSNLLQGLENRGVLDRELNSIISLKNIKNQFIYKKIARRLKISTNTLKKNFNSISLDEYKRISEEIRERPNKKIKIDYEKLFYKTRMGTVKNKNVKGKLTIIKIFSKNIIRYRDKKGRFISVK